MFFRLKGRLPIVIRYDNSLESDRSRRYPAALTTRELKFPQRIHAWQSDLTEAFYRFRDTLIHRKSEKASA
jgi:hypothetical protein